MVAGGLALFPGRLDQPVPQLGGAFGLSAKPLNSAGAGPPLNEFAGAQPAPQKVTLDGTIAPVSAITKLPPSEVP